MTTLVWNKEDAFGVPLHDLSNAIDTLVQKDMNNLGSESQTTSLYNRKWFNLVSLPNFFFIFYFTKPEEYLGTCQTCMVEFLLQIANSFQSLTIFAKNSIIDVWQGPKYSSEIFAPNC